MTLAIDQGSTKTIVALVESSGKIIAASTTSGACYFFVGMDAAFAEIEKGLEIVLKNTNNSKANVNNIIGGIAGANWQYEIEMLTAEAKSRFGVENVTIVNDCVPALWAGSDNPNGIVLCAGSQFNCAIKVGGEIKDVLNNYIHSDDQGGHALGLRALQTVFDSHIGRVGNTALTSAILDFYGHTDMDALILARDRNTLAKKPKDSAPLIFEVASKNDKAALKILDDFSRSIAAYATAAIKKYDLIGKDCDIVLSGGIFKADLPIMYDAISYEIHKVSQQAKIIQAKYEPIVGAALYGIQEKEICKKSAEKLGLRR